MFVSHLPWPRNFIQCNLTPFDQRHDGWGQTVHYRASAKRSFSYRWISAVEQCCDQHMGTCICIVSKNGLESTKLSVGRGSYMYILTVVCDDRGYGILWKVFAMGFSFLI